MKQIFVLLITLWIVQGVPLYSFTTGATVLDGVDDTCSAFVTTNSAFKFFGGTVSGFTVNPNGQIFLSSCKESKSPLTLPQPNDKIIAPFWANADFTVDVPSSNPASGVYYSKGIGASPIDGIFPTFTATEYFIVTWNKAPYFNAQTDRYNSFQAVVAFDSTNTYACFQYPDAADSGNTNGGLDWTEGTDTSGGILASNPAIVGFNAGDNIHYYLHPDSASDSIRSIDGVRNGAAAARQSGTYVGQYCYLISGNNLVSFNYPIVTATPYANNAQKAAFPVTGIDINTGITGTFNALNGANTASNTAVGDLDHRASTTLDVSSFPEGPFTITVSKPTSLTTFTSTSITVIKDTILSVAISSPAPNSWVNYNSFVTFQVSGSGENGATVYLVIIDSTSIPITTYSTTVSSGTWTITQSLETLVDGSITIVAHSQDPAGNTAQSSSLTVRKDTVIAVAITSPPPGTTILPSGVTAVQFQGTTDSASNNVLVIVQSSTTNIQRTATVAASRTWSVTIDISSLSDGPLDVYATATDAAGNSVSDSSSIIKDTSTYIAFDPLDTIGSFDASAYTVSGTAEPGALVSLSIASNSFGTTTASFDTTWEFVVNLSSYPDGSLTFTATAVDSLSNTATATAMVSKDSSASVRIDSPADLTLLLLSQVSNLQISGSGENSGRITLKLSDAFQDLYYSTTASPTGQWSISSMNISPLVDGFIDVLASIVDSTGNTGTDSIELIKDTVTSVSISSPTANQYVNFNQQSNLVVSGFGENRALIYVVISDTTGSTMDITSSTTTVNAAGIWSLTVNVASQLDGSITFVAHAVDPSGNTAVSIPVTASKDTVASISVRTPQRNDIVSSINVNNLPFSGSAEPFGIVRVTATDSRGTSVSSPTVTANYIGSWVTSANLNSLSDGPVTVVATLTDVAGNIGRATVPVLKDTSTAVLITSPSPNTYINLANILSLTVSGTGELNSRVFVTIDDGVAGTINIVTPTTSVSAAGTWQIAGIDVSSLYDGYLRITATLTDSSGNVRNSPVVVIIKDTQIELVIAVPTDYQFVISDARAPTLTISGFGDPDADVFVSFSDSSSSITSSIVEITPVGTWSVTTNVASLADGTISIFATGTDAAGNTADSQIIRLNKDTSVSSTSINNPLDGSTITQSQASSLLISGTGEPSGRISLRIEGTSGVISKTISVAPDGTWSVIANISALPNGTITIGGTSTDFGNNTSTISPIFITKTP